MSDLAEMYDNWREESKRRRMTHREWATKALDALGIDFESKNKGAHLIVRCAGKTIDYWPGTGKWIYRATKAGKRGIRSLMRAIDRLPAYTEWSERQSRQVPS